jgi:Amidase
VAATVAFTHRPAWSAISIDGRPYPHMVANGLYTMPFNLSGHPSVVIPIGQTQAGLPIGMQIIGKRWQDLELLAISQEIDKYCRRFSPTIGLQIRDRDSASIPYPLSPTPYSLTPRSVRIRLVLGRIVPSVDIRVLSCGVRIRTQ